MYDLRVVVTVMVTAVLDGAVPDGIDAGPKVTFVAEGLPEAENAITFWLGPPVVVRSMVKLAFVPAPIVSVVGGAAATLKSTPTPLSEMI